MGGERMATKLYNTHLDQLLCNYKQYYILDTYISVVHMCAEIKTDLDNKFIIQTYSDSLSHLTNLVKRYVNTTYKTIHNCLETLIADNFISYDSSLSAWIICGMENMIRNKKEAILLDEDGILFTGYTKIRPFFLSDEFHSMRATEKRLLVFMAQKSDSKNSNKFSNFVVNLNRRASGWYKVLRTSNKYYAKNIIRKMFDKYNDIIQPISDDDNYDYVCKQTKRFTLKFACPLIAGKKEKALLEEQAIDSVLSSNPTELELIENKANFLEITLSKKQKMHIIRCVISIKEWFLKDRIVQLILNKIRSIQVYKNKNVIRSLPGYAAAVVKSVLNEYKSFLKITNKLNEMEYYEYIDSFTSNEIDSKIDIVQNLYA